MGTPSLFAPAFSVACDASSNRYDASIPLIFLNTDFLFDPICVYK